MGCLVLVFLLLALILFGFGFVAHLVWVFAAIFFVLWLAGFAFGRGLRRGGRSR